MIRPTTFVLLTLVTVSNTLASDINLSCDDMAYRLARQFSNEGLIKNDEVIMARTRSIAITECRKAQKTAQAQLKVSKEDWVKNWLLEKQPDKPGNKRLRSLKK